nr:DEAD/DEAH box helicase family protein [Nitrosopumilus sp.]
KNSLVVVPTSLGKTIITLLICIDILFKWKNSKILILAPTRPLVHQHLDLFRRFTILGSNCFALTGKISPEIRKTVWKSSSIRIYFATPELVRNDIDNNILKKDDFYLVVFDEAHRAVKDYSYTSISKNFYDNLDSDKIPLILALSASPGSNREKIKKMCSSLFVEQIIVKSEDDEDVLPYVYNIDIEHNLIDLDKEHQEISGIFQSLIDDKIGWLIDNGFMKNKKKIENVYRKDLLNLADYLKSKISDSNNNNNNNNNNFFLYAALKYQSMAMILLYCRDLIESQGGFSLKKFFNKFKNEIPNKTYQELLSDPRIQKVLEMLKNGKASSHPKIQDTLSVVKGFLYSHAGKEGAASETNDKNSMVVEKTKGNNNTDNVTKNKSNLGIGGSNKRKILVFSQYRDTLEEIINVLNENDVPCKGFYGQSNKKNQKGINQDKQLSILNDFKKGLFPVLVATSVAEEGLDIPNVDLVVFYEPVPSEIRFIQRRGRTGRFSDGKVVVLVTNNSIDSIYLEIAQKKIAKMKHVLKGMGFDLNTYNKRSFDVTEKMNKFGIDTIPKKPVDADDGGAYVSDDGVGSDEYFNPVMDSISSNSSRKVKYFLKKLSYKKRYADGQNSSSSTSENDLELLYDVSLAMDNRKMVEKAQRRIHDLLAKSGKNGLDVSYLHTLTKLDRGVVKKAIENLEKIKRVVWINKRTISLADSVKFIPGKKYSIFIEKVLYGKAIVVVDQKWYASLDYFDYAGPRALLKKGNAFDVIGDVYKKNGVLHLMVKKAM